MDDPLEHTEPVDEPETSDPEEQHPALGGDPAAEVRQRRPEDGGDDQFQHTLVMLGRFDEHHPCHVDNARSVLESAIQRGLHPKGDVSLVELGYDEPGPHNRHTITTRATYAVQVVPAVIDSTDENVDTVTPDRLNKSLPPS